MVYNRFFLILLLFLLFGDQVMAQQHHLETFVVTATRDHQPLSELAGNTAVLDKNALRLVSHAHIQESLVRVAGANLARGNGQEYLPALRSPILTGAGACGSVLSAQDGVPLRAAGFCNINELFDAHTEMAQRIEVVRGPGSALFGSNAMHGVINVISPAVDVDGGKGIAVEGGPHDYTRLKLFGSHTQGVQGLRADLSLAHDGGYRDDSGFDQQKFTLRHEFSAGELAITSTLTATNLNQETAGYVAGTQAYKDSTLRDSNPTPEAYRDTRSLRISSQIDYQLQRDSRLTVTPYARYTDMDFLQHFLPGDPLEQNGQKSLGVLSVYHTQLSDSLTLATGLDLEYTDAFLKQRQDAPTQGSLFLQTTIPEGKHYDYQVRAVMAAPFVHATWHITDQFSASLGLRYEVMDYQYDNRMLDGRTDDNGVDCGFGGCRYSRPGDRDDRFENISPKLGVLYQLSDNQQLYLNVSQGYRAPQATELYRLQRDQGTADLDSEELLSAELGYRGQRERFVYEVILYAMKKQNVIFRDSDFFNVSNGETRHKGIELSLDYYFSDRLYLSLAASYAEHQYQGDAMSAGSPIDGNDVDSAPRHFGSARLGWDYSRDGRVELEWLHQGAYYTDPENAHRYKGHDLLNLSASLQVNKHWRLFTRLTNLTDKAYAERADYSSFAGDRYFPGEPRGVYLGIERSW